MTRLTKSIPVQKIHNAIKTIHMELITVIEYGSINECFFVKLRFNKI